MNPAQELASLEELLDQLLRGIQDILQSGEVLTDEFQGVLAQELEATTNRIDQLRMEIQQNPVEGMQPPPPPEPELDSAPYPSSNIHAFKYDYKNKRLLVKFQGKDVAASGPIYAYEGIHPFIYNIFKEGAVAPKTSGRNKWHRWEKGVMPSLGAAMYHLIRNGGYSYQRLS